LVYGGSLAGSRFLRPSSNRVRRLRLIILTIVSSLAIQAQGDLPARIGAAQSSGNYSEAVKLYSQLIASGTDSPEIRSNYGIMLHLTGENRKSLEQFRLALRRNSNMAPANLFAGMAEYDLHEYRAALPYLKRARELDPQGTPPLLALAKVHVALREYHAANECYAHASSLDPTLAEAWYGVGVTDRAQADELLNRATRSAIPTDSALVAEQTGRFLNAALTALNRAIELEPTSERAHLIKAEALSDAGRFTEAVSEYQAALKIDPGLTAAYLGLATGYWKEREFEQALPLLKQVLDKSPEDPEANGIMADILEHNGDLASAKRHAEVALAGNPDLIQTHVVLARIYLAGKQPALSIAQLQKVITADPDGSYHFLLFRAYRDAGDERSATAALAEFQRLRGRESKP
jgi:tetratricopeptide (TPR) repeat protein